jgi:hypothetical protein
LFAFSRETSKQSDGALQSRQLPGRITHIDIYRQIDAVKRPTKYTIYFFFWLKKKIKNKGRRKYDKTKSKRKIMTFGHGKQSVLQFHWRTYPSVQILGLGK